MTRSYDAYDFLFVAQQRLIIYLIVCAVRFTSMDWLTLRWCVVLFEHAMQIYLVRDEKNHLSRMNETNITLTILKYFSINAYTHIHIFITQCIIDGGSNIEKIRYIQFDVRYD